MFDDIAGCLATDGVASPVLQTIEQQPSADPSSRGDNIRDAWLRRLVTPVEDRSPADPVPGSFGMDQETGQLSDPVATRASQDSYPVDIP